MKFLLIAISLIFVQVCLYGQNKIPESIDKDLVLKPMGKPYESTGFTLEKGITLTIMPGAVINFDNKVGKKGTIEINGTLIIGDKGAAKSKPVIFQGWIAEMHFKNAKIEINGWEATLTRYQFIGDNSGSIRNSSLLRNQATIPYSIYLQVPKKDSLAWINCWIDDQSLEIITSDFPNDLSRFSMTGCAFTHNIKSDKGLYDKKLTLPILAFAYGTRCDSYIEVEFKPFNWELKSALATEWYVDDAHHKKTLEGSAKLLKGYSLKLGTKKYTTIKQEEKTAEKDEKKK